MKENKINLSLSVEEISSLHLAVSEYKQTRGELPELTILEQKLWDYLQTYWFNFKYKTGDIVKIGKHEVKIILTSGNEVTFKKSKNHYCTMKKSEFMKKRS